MFQSVEFELAKREIKNYDDEALIQESKQAQDCMDCEAFLQKGIGALQWLERAEEALFQGHAAGFVDISPELEAMIDHLYKVWTRPCAFAESWIQQCEINGFEIGNRNEFRECCGRAEYRIEQAERYHLAKELRDERLAQDPW